MSFWRRIYVHTYDHTKIISLFQQKKTVSCNSLKIVGYTFVTNLQVPSNRESILPTQKILSDIPSKKHRSGWADTKNWICKNICKCLILSKCSVLLSIVTTNTCYRTWLCSIVLTRHYIHLFNLPLNIKENRYF